MHQLPVVVVPNMDIECFQATCGYDPVLQHDIDRQIPRSALDRDPGWPFDLQALTRCTDPRPMTGSRYSEHSRHPGFAGPADRSVIIPIPDPLEPKRTITRHVPKPSTRANVADHGVGSVRSGAGRLPARSDVQNPLQDSHAKNLCFMNVQRARSLQIRMLTTMGHGH